MLRIIAGKFKGSLLEQPDLKITRSTTDRVREAIFSSIQNEIKGSIILDLFSGSGALAIESISRGAMKVVCVDSSPDSISIIRSNVKKLLINNIDIYNQNCLSFLSSKKGTKYDIIFLDPPYENISLLNKVLDKLSKESFLNNYGKIIIENQVKNSLKIIVPKEMILHKIKKYGKTEIIFIKNIL